MVDDSTDVDLNCLSYWFPKLAATGVAVPRTEIVRAPPLHGLLDGKLPDGWEKFITELRKAGSVIGYPLFLRTGIFSGKHWYRKTCYLRGPGQLKEHVRDIVEHSALADIMGLPTDVWAVREFLPLEFSFTAFDGLPIARERRYFLRDGSVECHHPYWPEEAIENAHHNLPLPPHWKRKLAELNTETPAETTILGPASKRVANAFPGYWSLDWAYVWGRGWCVIDMARGEQSWHPECQFAVKEDEPAMEPVKIVRKENS